MKAVIIEIDDYKAMNKTTTHIFQLRNILKCQIILKKNTNLISIEKKSMTFFQMGFFSRLVFANSRGGLLFELGFFST